MVAANMAAYNYEEPHSFLFRLYGSIAAPCFIFLSGILVPYTMQVHQRKLFYFMKKSVYTLLVAASIDVFLWHLFPFSSFDVLYVIGISLILNYFLSRLSKIFHLFVAILLILISFFLQYFFGYETAISEISLNDQNIFSSWFSELVLKNLFIEGWFPLFPWLGVSALGAFMGRQGNDLNQVFETKKLIIIGISLLLMGIITWGIFQPTLFVRDGYSELFYPPTISYLLTFIGLVFILLFLFHKLQSTFISRFFSVFGQSSLLMYILHTLLVVILFKPYFNPSSFFPMFFLLYLFHLIILWLIAFFVQKLKPYFNNYPSLIKFILGV